MKSSKKIVNRRAVMIVVVHALFLIIVYIVQSLVFPFVNAMPTIPLLLPLAAAGAAMFEGGARGAAMGLIAGALCDLSFNKPIAAFALLLTVVCLIIGVLAETVLARNFLSYLVVGFLTLVICAFAQMFTLLFFEHADLRALLIEALRQTLISMPFCIVIYPVAKVMYKAPERI
jgi:cell shape-determining protein MreD